MNYIYIFYMLLVLSGGLVMITIAHEEVHKEIFRGYGVDSEISYFDGWKFSPKTTGEKACPNYYCELAHNINEIVGYTLEALWLGLGTLIIVYRLSLEDRW